MPLTDKGKEIMRSMKKEYGPKKGERVFYASKNKGTISGVEEMKYGGFTSTGDDTKDLNLIRMGKGGKTKSRVNEAGNYTKPSLRKRLFEKIKAGGKGGKPGQWSARKAQMLAKQYKEAGGGYKN
jgi:hypothetical protein